MFELIASNMFQNFILNLFMLTLLVVFVIGIFTAVCIITYDLVIAYRKHLKQLEEIEE